MPAIAPPLAIPPEDLHTLGQWSRSGGIRAALAERAKILLLAAQGTSNTEIAHQVGCSRPTVILWRRRYAQGGLDGLLDRPRPGRPQTVRRGRRAEILAVTLSPPPEHLGVTHWSSRLLADQLGVSHNTVARVWAEHDLKPWRTVPRVPQAGGQGVSAAAAAPGAGHSAPTPGRHGWPAIQRIHLHFTPSPHGELDERIAAHRPLRRWLERALQRCVGQLGTDPSDDVDRSTHSCVCKLQQGVGWRVWGRNHRRSRGFCRYSRDLSYWSGSLR